MGYTEWIYSSCSRLGANIAAFKSPTEAVYDPNNPDDLSKINPLLAAAQGGHIATLKAMLSEKKARPSMFTNPAAYSSSLGHPLSRQ
jgi:ankyrin repeat protein